MFNRNPFLICKTMRGTQASVIHQIVDRRRTRTAREAHAGPRSPPSTRAPARRGSARAPCPTAHAPPVT
jgi:hypothetical protein